MNCNLILCLQAEEYIDISFTFVQYIYGWDYRDISLCLDHCFGVIKLIFVLLCKHTRAGAWFVL